MLLSHPSRVECAVSHMLLSDPYRVECQWVICCCQTPTELTVQWVICCCQTPTQLNVSESYAIVRPLQSGMCSESYAVRPLQSGMCSESYAVVRPLQSWMSVSHMLLSDPYRAECQWVICYCQTPTELNVSESYAIVRPLQSWMSVSRMLLSDPYRVECQWVICYCQTPTELNVSESYTTPTTLWTLMLFEICFLPLLHCHPTEGKIVKKFPSYRSGHGRGILYDTITHNLLHPTLTGQQPGTDSWIFLYKLHDNHDCWITLIFDTK